MAHHTNSYYCLWEQTHRQAHTHCTLCKQDQFLETRHVSGLIMLPLMMSATCVIHPHYIFILLYKWIITTKGSSSP